MSSNRVTMSEKSSSGGFSSKIVSIITIGVAIVSVATLAITIAIVAQVYKDQSDDLSSDNNQTTVQPLTLAARIQVKEAIDHLKELQRIADSENGTRAVNTPGFNRTLDYIKNTLNQATNFNVKQSFFMLRNYRMASNHTFITSINGVEKERLFSTTLPQADFYLVQYTRPINIATFTSIVVIPNLGCDRSDWQSVSANGQIVLVKRGDCTFVEKAAFATEFGARVLMFYNDGTAPDRNPPILVNLGADNNLAALFLSYNLGNELANAASDPNTNTGVKITINILDESTYPVGNICADTPTGDPTKTIVIGAHSDSVTAGPGINDNGSGSSSVLTLALTLYRLYQESSYAKYSYRVRFCWWGAEELGLLGSQDHVLKAANATDVGERLSDYLINLNYDMLGSPNFMFGIYDAKTAPSSTPVSALAGSNQTTDLFVNWFKSQNLPWDYTEFSGRSDYGPFLARGIVAGGLFTGADGTKTLEQRDRYASYLGQTLAGFANAIHDPCYHRACDTIGNINEFALEKMLQAAGHVLETMGQNQDLVNWLYPNGRPKIRLENLPIYDPIAEYFNLPYS